MLPITPRCAGMLLFVCAAIQGATVDDAEPEGDPKRDALVIGPGIVLVFGTNSGVVTDCRDGPECGEFQECSLDDGVCECAPGYHWTLTGKVQVCVQCPAQHHPCGDNNCCYPANKTRCYNNTCQCRYEVSECRTETADQFKLATQIALVSAIILVLACLLVILWRTCRRQHGQMRRRRVLRRSDASEASLTSVQLRVVERMRNRPPGYHDRSHIRIEKPPSYEETIGQPLRYPALVLDPAYIQLEDQRGPTHGHLEPTESPVATAHGPLEDREELEGPTLATGNANAPSGGVDNSAFEDDERDSKQAPSPEVHM